MAPALSKHPEQLRTLAAQLMLRVESLDQLVEKLDKQVHHFKTVNEQLTHESRCSSAIALPSAVNI